MVFLWKEYTIPLKSSSWGERRSRTVITGAEFMGEMGKGVSRWPPFPWRENLGFKSFCCCRRETGCWVLGIISPRHHLQQEVGWGERKLIAEVACLPSESLLQEQAFRFWEVANSARQTQLHDRQFTLRLATSWHKSVVLFHYLSFGLLADGLRGA